jgi:hypothetical protein
MEKFDQYDEIEYTGKSNPNIWEVHLEYFFSKEAALKRYATIFFIRKPPRKLP